MNIQSYTTLKTTNENENEIYLKVWGVQKWTKSINCERDKIINFHSVPRDISIIFLFYNVGREL